MRATIEVLKDAQKAIERLGGLNCNENGNSDYGWLDEEIEAHINKDLKRKRR
jgi:hypothetical protein